MRWTAWHLIGFYVTFWRALNNFSTANRHQWTVWVLPRSIIRADYIVHLVLIWAETAFTSIKYNGSSTLASKSKSTFCRQLLTPVWMGLKTACKHLRHFVLTTTVSLTLFRNFKLKQISSAEGYVLSLQVIPDTLFNYRLHRPKIDTQAVYTWCSKKRFGDFCSADNCTRDNCARTTARGDHCSQRLLRAARIARPTIARGQ